MKVKSLGIVFNSQYTPWTAVYQALSDPWDLARVLEKLLPLSSALAKLNEAMSYAKELLKMDSNLNNNNKKRTVIEDTVDGWTNDNDR